MSKQSAGLLLYRKRDDLLEVFLVHPGGPLWAKKDLGAWSIPKGEFDGNEDALTAAKREFREETGLAAPEAVYLPLTPVRQKSGKVVHAWAVRSNLAIETIHSNAFEMEWPPKSGRRQSFPEVDKADWFLIETALEKINSGQAELLHELAGKLKLGH